MKDILRAIQRNEEVQLLYRGKPTAKIVPIRKKSKRKSIADHPFFGSKPPITKEEVDKIMDELRGGRYRDL
jgi:antitoxin (DNA-binding transcriptional repressor) of toxin-antitoxin stability system